MLWFADICTRSKLSFKLEQLNERKTKDNSKLNQKQYFLTNATSLLLLLFSFLFPFPFSPSSSFSFYFSPSIGRKLPICWLPSSTLARSFPSFIFSLTAPSVSVSHQLRKVSVKILCRYSFAHQGQATMGSGRWGSPRAIRLLGRPVSMDITLTAEWTRICTEDIGPCSSS